jgi:O-antigen/teichoic acid export membrane protein
MVLGDKSRRSRRWTVLTGVAQLGSGEFVGRLCATATLVILGHRYGATVVGIFALAQGLTQYLQPLIDFGLRHTGARLVAKYPGATSQVVRVVQSRRRTMLLIAFPLIVGYVWFLRVQPGYRAFILAFAACGCLYALSLDWLAWGKQRFKVGAFSRAIVPVAILASVGIGWSSSQPFTFVFAGHASGQLLLVVVIWAWSRSEGRHARSEGDSPEIAAELRFRRTAILGLALFSNMAFNSIDILLLGVFRSPAEVGLYSAAYRILNQAFLMYYLITQSLYPEIAKLTHAERTRMLRSRILGSLFASGAVLALLFIWQGDRVLRLLFGETFVIASPLLAILALAIPLDFLTSYLSTAYVAWGMERQVLVSTAAGAITNIALNVAFMPAYGTKAAAINTVLSYAVFLVSLIIVRGSARTQMSNETSLGGGVVAI